MLYLIMAAAFQYVEMTDEVGLGVSVRVFQ